MYVSPTECLAALRSCLHSAAAELGQTDDPAQRAATVARALRALWPCSPLFACRLTQGGGTTCALDKDGQGRPTWAAALGPLLSRGGGGEEGQTVPLPAGVELRGHVLAVQPLRSSGIDHGALALALPAQPAGEGASLPRELLAACAGPLAEHLGPGQDLQEHEALAALALLASPVTHEFNNFLNVALLQVAVMEQQVSESLRADLAAIRKQGKEMGMLVRQWQQHRRGQNLELGPVDLNAAVHRAVEAIARERAGNGPTILIGRERAAPPRAEVQIRLDLAPDLPPVSGTPAYLEHLVRFLITNATVACRAGVVTVATGRDGDKVLLRVEDLGPTVDPEVLSRYFEPLGTAREGVSQLELAACETLVRRRLQGKIDVENRPGGGAVVVVRLNRGGE